MTDQREKQARAAAARHFQELRPALELWLLLLTISGLFGIVGGLIQTGSPWFDVGFSGLSVAVVARYARREHDLLVPWLRWSGLSIRGCVLAFGGISVLVAFMSLYFAGLTRLGVPFVSNLATFREYGWPLWTAFVMICVVPSVLEEIAFRGLIMGRLEQAMGSGEALVVQAAMFSVLHLNPLIFPSHFVVGLLLGVIRRRSGSLLPCILVHAAWNAWVLAMELMATPSGSAYSCLW